MEHGKKFNYGHVTKLEYEDIDYSSIMIDVSSFVGSRRVRLDEGNLVVDCCHPKSLRKDIQTNNNLLVALQLYVTEEMMNGGAQTPPKKSRKSNPVHKKYNKQPRPNEDDDEVLEFVEEEEEHQVDVVAPGGQLSSGVLTFEQNKIRENIVKTKLVRKG